MSMLAGQTTDGARSPGAQPVSSAYGHFSPDGREYCITNWRTPRPWSNIISNRRFGLAVTQTGSGFTWIDNSQLAVVTRWQQDLARDSSGKFLYVRDADSGKLWSLAPAPTFPEYAKFECRHGLGYTTFLTEFDGIRASWTLFPHAHETIELWRVELENLGDRPRRLDVTAYLEWNCGVAPAPRREFQKLFLETQFDPRRRAIFARNHMWDVPSARRGHWNTDFPYVCALATSEPLLAALGDQTAFLGRYGDPRAPQALERDTWKVQFGRHEDAIAAMRSAIELRPRGLKTIGYGLAAGETHARTAQLVDDLVRTDAIDAALVEARAQWEALLAENRVETPEPSLNYLANDWSRYQAISARIWGRAGYYQQSGAYGFRDQLQDSQVWLTSAPAECRAQLKLHAARQFTDGSVYHWWHPLTEQGHITRITDDLLWLALVGGNYIRETGDLSLLAEPAPFLDDARDFPLAEHVQRAFERVFARTSPRGLPFIGAGDWNDGLSACGLDERGESVWLAQMLVGVLADWAEIYRRAAAPGTKLPRLARPYADLAADFAQRRAALIRTINTHAWDGAWYSRGTLDDGTIFGSAANRVGRIFLNTQTWAILNDVAPPDRAAECLASVKKHLISPAGALLLAPAFDVPDESIGYITRYAPGLRENGGVYSHAATWAIAAACKLKDANLVAQLLTAMNPALKDADRFWAEPYVMPGNVDGPDSPHHGRAGWSWYTGSAQWLQRVVTHWVLGVRPEWDGLRIDPCLPPDWNAARMSRLWRGCTYDLRFERVRGASGSSPPQVSVDGQRLATNMLALPRASGLRHEVLVRVGG